QLDKRRAPSSGAGAMKEKSAMKPRFLIYVVALAAVIAALTAPVVARAGFPRFRQATRLFTQPSAAAESGKIFIALNSSTSPTFDDPNANSEIRLLFSLNGGVSWQAVTVVPAIFDRHHVLPFIAATKGGERLHIAYSVQPA